MAKGDRLWPAARSRKPRWPIQTDIGPHFGQVLCRSTDRKPPSPSRSESHAWGRSPDPSVPPRNRISGDKPKLSLLNSPCNTPPGLPTLKIAAFELNHRAVPLDPFPAINRKFRHAKLRQTFCKGNRTADAVSRCALYRRIRTPVQPKLGFVRAKYFANHSHSAHSLGLSY